MAGLKCSNCGGSIRYHGIPNGIEYTVFPIENWNKIISCIYNPDDERIHEEWPVPGPYLYRTDTIWEDFKDDYFEVWVCPHCGTLEVFDNSGVHVKAVYRINDDKIKIDNNAKKYIAFSDYVWEKVTESSIPVSEIPDKYESSYYIIANSDYVWLFESNFESNYSKVYKRIPIATE